MTAIAGTIVGIRWTYGRLIICAILAMVFVRLVCAANMPLATDELLYWRYSKHLAAGFLDHPALNPFLIGVGTSLFGDTPFGVRAMAVLLGVPATWAVWRSASILFDDTRAGATAALLFNLTVTMSVGSLLATSDSVVVATSAFLIFFLAKLSETERGLWWIAIGAAFGVGMWAKYTTFLFAPGILAWLLIVPRQRKWLFSPWPYLGGLVAAIVFAPVVVWNAEHHWASLAYQSSRMEIAHWTSRYVFELIASQVGLLTPPIFVLVCVGGFWALRDKSLDRSARVLLGALVTPAALYFFWHALHERVQGNWPENLVPAFACLAGLAVVKLGAQKGALGLWTRISYWAAAPFAVVLAGLIYLQAIFGLLPIGARDPTSTMLGAGWNDVADRIETIRDRVGATVFLTTDYATASQLSYYVSPGPTAVEQINDRIRWVNEPAPSPALFSGQMIYVCRDSCPYARQLSRRFDQVEYLETIPRTRNGVVIDRVSLFRISNPRRATLDDLYPIRTKASDEYSL